MVKKYEPTHQKKKPPNIRFYPYSEMEIKKKKKLYIVARNKVNKSP